MVLVQWRGGAGAGIRPYPLSSKPGMVPRRRPCSRHMRASIRSSAHSAKSRQRIAATTKRTVPNTKQLHWGRLTLTHQTQQRMNRLAPMAKTSSTIPTQMGKLPKTPQHHRRLAQFILLYLRVLETLPLLAPQLPPQLTYLYGSPRRSTYQANKPPRQYTQSTSTPVSPQLFQPDQPSKHLLSAVIIVPRERRPSLLQYLSLVLPTRLQPNSFIFTYPITNPTTTTQRSGNLPGAVTYPKRTCPKVLDGIKLPHTTLASYTTTVSTPATLATLRTQFNLSNHLFAKPHKSAFSSHITTTTAVHRKYSAVQQ